MEAITVQCVQIQREYDVNATINNRTIFESYS